MGSSVHIPGVELGGELGRGAFSVVFRGRIDHKPCAVKVPLFRGAWTRWVYREGVALARVHHPNLPAVLEVGEVDELPYIVMELVEGENLHDRLQRGPLGHHEALDVAMHLAAALGAVHRVGLVHRDVKPQNIILGRDGGVRLVDFGFATPLELAIRDGAGTHGFAAPEQLRVNARVDGRADLYGVGRVLIQCLRGRDGDEQGLRLDESPFAPIIAGLVPRDPEDRYPDATALLRDLEALQRGQAALGPGAYSAESSLLPIIGRNPELERLNRTWMTLPATGSVVLLRGPGGGGKTRLLAACMTAARDARRCRVLDVSCREADPPLATLRRIVEAIAGSSPPEGSTAREASKQRLRRAVGDQLQPFVRLISPRLADFMGLRETVADSAPGGFAEGAADLLVRLVGAGGPVLLCIDDVQWIDPVSRDTVVRFAERIGTIPASLIMTVRADTHPTTIDDFVARSRSTRIDLALFDEAQAAALVSSYLAVRSVDGTLVRRVAAMADGTPLGVLEVLGAFLDAGALRPHHGAWHFDVDRAERIELPRGSLALLGHRLAELPPATRRVLEAAAIIGTTFDDRLLSRIVGLDLPDLGFAFNDARQAGLIEACERGAHRLVHDSLRELLVATLAEGARRALHQRIAEALDQDDAAPFESICSSALHYAAGEPDKRPERAYATARRAADEALARFDNETSLHFLALARLAASRAELKLDAAFYRSQGEAWLRLGALDSSLAAFQEALAQSVEAESRAALLGRIAWVEQAGANPERAWSALSRAFSEIGASMPVENAPSAVSTFGHFVRAALKNVASTRPANMNPSVRPSRIELLCDLHYQNSRLGMEYEKPFRFVQSTLDALALSQTLGPSRAQARARASYGIVLAAIGRHHAARREIERAKRIAAEVGDSITSALCVQLDGVAACASGDLERGLQLFQECIDVHAPWLELNEYCLDASSGDAIESLRGRPREALVWNTRAIERERRTLPAAESAAEYLIHRRRSGLASLGRSFETDSALALRGNPTRSARQSFHRTLSWGPRARLLLETDEIGPALDRLLLEFDSEHKRARSSHPEELEYYVCVAHARLHACLRGTDMDTSSRLASLRTAIAALRANAKLNLAKAHLLFLEGSYAWLDGSTADARRHLAEAEELAQAERAPWVLSSVARIRAHMLRQEGKLEAAKDLARTSELIATEHGAAPHARWVREEFSLAAPAATAVSAVSSSAAMSSRLRRQLTSLLNIVRRPSVDVHPSDQAARILDDLLHDLDAERGVLWFNVEPGVRDELVVGRAIRGQAWSALPSDPEAEPGSRTISVPLILHETTVGGVRIERSTGARPFGHADHELLLVLSHQIPITFEIGRLLAEREQLQRSLQHALKMEAVGQLAGGIAHDFNNMLHSIRSSLYFLRENAALSGAASAEVTTIEDAVTRAADLTGQLLSFSRHQPMPLEACQVNDMLEQMSPILRRLVGDEIRLDLDLAANLHVVETVRSGLDQAIVNLVVNARDAMPAGGTLRIVTRNALLDAAAVRRGASREGDHVAIDVIDSGRGISPDVLARIFDPFFTTKPREQGTGLGLTTTYAFVKKCRGNVEVVSELDRGTTFTIYLPRADALALPARADTVAPATPKREAPVGGSSTILVVDDDYGVRSSMEKVLRRAGYRVLVAEGATDAVELVRQHGADISLVILDVMMPGMNGPDLSRHIGELRVNVPVLFVSGFAADSVPVSHEAPAEHFLQKPFDLSELLQRVRHLLDAA